MGRVLVLLLVVAACTDLGANPPATTAPPPPVTTETTTTSSSSPTTSAPAPTTSTTAAPTTTLAPLQGLAYETVADGLAFPTFLTARPGSDLAYVLTKDGRIWALSRDEVGPEPVLDIAERVRNSGEQGLLGMALHPGDPERMFLHYSATDGDTVVAEYHLPEPRRADPDGERVLLRLDQPAANHNGGMIQFGPDGSLYLGLGDGGGANDTFGNGQNRDTLLGGLVRLDPDGGPESAELFQYGLRNPWRFWIEEELVYIADVGQNLREEIDVAPLDPGLNYGWPIMEGLECFQPPSGCDTEGLTLPVVQVSHGDAGTCSITGGVVYRGPRIPELDGHYLYSDFCGGWLRSFRWDGSAAVDHTDWTAQVGVPGQVTSFGVDGAADAYVLTTTSVLRLVPRR